MQLAMVSCLSNVLLQAYLGPDKLAVTGNPLDSQHIGRRERKKAREERSEGERQLVYPTTQQLCHFRNGSFIHGGIYCFELIHVIEVLITLSVTRPRVIESMPIIGWGIIQQPTSAQLRMGILVITTLTFPSGFTAQEKHLHSPHQREGRSTFQTRASYAKLPQDSLERVRFLRSPKLERARNALYSLSSQDVAWLAAFCYTSLNASLLHYPSVSSARVMLLPVDFPRVCTVWNMVIQPHKLSHPLMAC